MHVRYSGKTLIFREFELEKQIHLNLKLMCQLHQLFDDGLAAAWSPTIYAYGSIGYRVLHPSCPANTL